MNIILLQTAPTAEELGLLLKEFPQYLFLSLTPTGYKNLTHEHWSLVEVIFGNRLSIEELNMAPQLRWIHLPSQQMNRLCVDEIVKRGSILVTSTTEENISQIGEFALGGILAFAKQLFQWSTTEHSPKSIWSSKLRDTMWSLQDRTLLQIGLDKRGTEIARRCRQMNMRIYGAGEHKTFHPYCHKTISYDDIYDALPDADVVCICLPNEGEWAGRFGRNEFERMKPDCILMVIGSHAILQEEALMEAATAGKFRGILLDASYDTPPAQTSLIWDIPNILITPAISPRPKNIKTQAFRTFLYNLRQYRRGNFSEMRNNEPLDVLYQT